MARIANAVQCHSLLSGHYHCNVLMLATVRNVNNFTTSLRLCSLCICHCQVTFSHHSDQMSQRSQVSCMDLYSDYVWTAKNISGSCFLYIIVFSMCALRNGVSPLLEQ